MSNRILIPHDGSDFSRQIFGYVIKLLTTQDTELILLRVVPPPGGITGAPTHPTSVEVPIPMFDTSRDAEYASHPIYASQEIASLESKTLEDLEEDARRLRKAGYAVSTHCRFGDAAPEIVKFAESERVDALAMTTHGRSGLSRLIFGSVAHAVLRDLGVPIMLFRPTPE